MENPVDEKKQAGKMEDFEFPRQRHVPLGVHLEQAEPFQGRITALEHLLEAAASPAGGPREHNEGDPLRPFQDVVEPELVEGPYPPHGTLA